MDASSLTITELLDGAKKQFFIPVYQRTYNWRQRDCDTLFEDLLAVYNKKYPSHFFGSIVYIRKEDDFTIIDGQQRITTVSLLLLAIRNYIRNTDGMEGKCKLNPDQIFHSYLIHQYEQDENKRIRLSLIDSDQQAYKQLIDDMEPIEDCCVTVNYKILYKRISELSPEEIVGIYDAVSRLSIVKISLDLEKGDDPQLIFESLNSTGLALTEADKVRNFVLMNMETYEQKQAYKKYWVPIEENTPNKDMTDFIRYYLAVKTRVPIASKKIYIEFKHYRNNTGNNINDILKDMLIYSRYYKNIMMPSPNDSPLEKALARFRKFEANTPVPILMDIFKAHEDNLISDEEQCEAVSIIESWLLRREVCGLETKSLNKIFVYLGDEIAKYVENHKTSWLDVFKYYILEKKGKSRYPNDHDFDEKFMSYELYNAKSTIRKYILERLENCNSKEKIAVEEQLDNGDLTIEHIMPQTITPAWKTILGKNWEQIHTKYKDTPGNLTLTAYNSSYSNLPFVEKKKLPDKGFAYSKLYLNKYVKKQDNWTEKEIRERAKRLCEDAKKIWPLIISNLGDADDDTWVEWDDEYDYTNVNVSRIIIFGETKKTKDFTDAYKKINTSLYALDPAGYTEYVPTVCPQNTIRMPYKISNNVSVELNKSSQAKIAFIKKVSSHLGLSGKDIRFNVSPKFNIKDENTYNMIKIGALAYSLIEDLLKTNRLSEEDIGNLKSKDYSHNLFKSLHYPVLANSRGDNKGNSSHIRYYKKPVEVNGKKVYITTQWFDSEREVLVNWYRSKK
ncbi:DUF262 domain-containing protein [Anaerovibrio lipolyticus]|uniref:DUF262 domain-containing protein n=1 Tax=Anaerovibrio lipolyticus TaxID=82374 RepID=UPI0025F77C23|nr:DUF262 domain-containing HNH endonuclease family protein [Anaerovibrio lipolyticus]